MQRADGDVQPGGVPLQPEAEGAHADDGARGVGGAGQDLVAVGEHLREIAVHDLGDALVLPTAELRQVAGVDHGLKVEVHVLVVEFLPADGQETFLLRFGKPGLDAGIRRGAVAPAGAVTAIMADIERLVPVRGRCHGRNVEVIRPLAAGGEVAFASHKFIDVEGLRRGCGRG